MFRSSRGYHFLQVSGHKPGRSGISSSRGQFIVVTWAFDSDQLWNLGDSFPFWSFLISFSFDWLCQIMFINGCFYPFYPPIIPHFNLVPATSGMIWPCPWIPAQSARPETLCPQPRRLLPDAAMSGGQIFGGTLKSHKLLLEIASPNPIVNGRFVDGEDQRNLHHQHGRPFKHIEKCFLGIQEAQMLWGL